MFIPGVCWVIAWCCNYGACGERTGMGWGVNPRKKGFSVLPHELRLLPGSLQQSRTVDMYTNVDFISTKGKWKHNHTQSYSQTYLAPLWVHSPHSLSPCEGAGKSAKNRQPQFSLSFLFSFSFLTMPKVEDEEWNHNISKERILFTGALTVTAVAELCHKNTEIEKKLN